MKALDKKLIRDVRRIWAQAIAIALVMACGVATIVLALGAYRSLDETREAYYDRFRFGEVFAQLTRAPLSVAETIRELPGVLAVQPGIKQYVMVDVEGMIEPATGVAIALPETGRVILDRLHVRLGRLPEPGHSGEVAVHHAFAKAHDLKPGDQFRAIINGQRRTLTITGVVLSPAYIYALGPGDLMPDDRRFVAFWMDESALMRLLDLQGSFNHLSIRLVPGVEPQAVIGRIDHVLDRYGGIGAYSRKEQTSHAFLDAELKQLSAMGRVIPPIFLLVSAFLINLVLSRLIALEREQIGLLKAIGYSNFEIAAHYTKLALLISVAGILIGAVAGTWLGQGLTQLYGDFFHFPFLIFTIEPDLYAISGLVTALAAIIGSGKAIREALGLSPAVAMQPPAPPRYKRFLPHSLNPRLSIAPLVTMSVRHMLRWPIRAAMTALGIALAVAVLVTALFTFDAVEEMIEVAFFRTDRQHASVSFAKGRPEHTLLAVARLPGVLRAEPYRAVPVRMRNGHLERRLSIFGKPSDMELSRVLDLEFQPVTLPSSGLVISERLAEVLQLRRGDTVDVEILDGRRPKLSIVVADIIKTYFGIVSFMDLSALNELVGEGPQINGVHIGYDMKREEELYRAVKQTPAIGAVALKTRSLVRFRETIAENINIMTSVYIGLSCIIAFGVVYNSARIQLSERARELATLRVLGFTRAEVSWVLLTELAILTALAIPLGWLLGAGFAWATVQGFTNDIYSVPFIVEKATYAKAALIVLIATVLSALVVRRRIDRFDLVSVLKARD